MGREAKQGPSLMAVVARNLGPVRYFLYGALRGLPRAPFEYREDCGVKPELLAWLV